MTAKKQVEEKPTDKVRLIAFKYFVLEYWPYGGHKRRKATRRRVWRMLREYEFSPKYRQEAEKFFRTVCRRRVSEWREAHERERRSLEEEFRRHSDVHILFMATA